MTTSSLLASISSVAAVWYGLGNAAVSETASVAGTGSEASGSESTVYEVPTTLRNVYPAANFNRNVTTTWWATEILDGHSAEEAVGITAALKSASFVVLDQDMYQLLGNDGSMPAVETIFDFPPGPFFANRIVHDGTVYAPECNCIFFAELHPPKKGFSADAMPWVWRVNLNDTPPTIEQVYPSPRSHVYWAHEGNYTVPSGIVRMDPRTLETEMVLNNFFGHRFNSPNDVVITRDGVAYFTDGYYGFDNFNDTLRPELANGVWRWNMETGDLRMVSGAGGGPFKNPNGVALNLKEDKLYVTNRGNASDNPAGGRTIYEFQLHQTGLPVRGGDVFSYADSGFPDGIKLDAEGRVYGGVTGGVSVFDSAGKQLGIIKVAEDDVAVNMQFVDDWLYIAGRSHLYRVQLKTRGAQSY
ncbi:gluconolactonase precursor [Colletotrichum plurivorum]|uniref:Gluconolactonase n=1 Tax=Colletotrichum plurivorum TaxID=2175906 RepID=A0A8H6MZV1_9PEZI|nr:gluconolactonase precursor [Colletotrichum plurivorum]